MTSDSSNYHREYSPDGSYSLFQFEKILLSPPYVLYYLELRINEKNRILIRYHGIVCDCIYFNVSYSEEKPVQVIEELCVRTTQPLISTKENNFILQSFWFYWFSILHHSSAYAIWRPQHTKILSVVSIYLYSLI